MDQHFDENILKAQKQLKMDEAARHSNETVAAENAQSIHDEFVNIFGIPTRFKLHEVLDGKASIMMPVDFELRSIEEIKSIFINGSPPQVLYGNSYSYFMVSFNLTEHTISPDDLADFMAYAKQTLERMGPGAHVIKTDVLSTGENDPVAVLDLVSNAIQGTSYSVIFYSVINGHLLISSIQFGKQFSERLLPIAHEIVQSFSINREEVGEV